MAKKRSKPLLIASFLPIFAFASLAFSEKLHGSRYLPVFVVLWSMLLAGLFTYVLMQTVRARKARVGR